MTTILGRQRKFEDPLTLDHLAHSRAARLDHRGIGLYFDLFAHLTDVENWIDRQVAVHLQDDSCLHKRTETRQRRLDPIRTQRQIRQDVGSSFICDGCPSDAGFALCRSYRDSGEDCPTLISNGAADLCCCLSPDAWTSHQRYQ